MAGTFNTIFVIELILKLPKLNHSTEIYAKYYLTNKLLNYLGKDLLHLLEIIFNFKNETITWQEVSISIKPPNCAAKEIFAIKESRPVRNATKRIKRISDAEYNKINFEAIFRSLKYLKDKRKNSLLELFQI